MQRLVDEISASLSIVLDKFWMQQDVKYNFMADLARISDRSVHEISGL